MNIYLPKMVTWQNEPRFGTVADNAAGSTSQYGRIQIGSNAQVRPQQPIGGSYTAIVTVVDQVLDAASGTFGVRLALPNPERQLPAGIRCKVLFEAREAASLDATPPGKK
jgi:hypothetical protein